MVQPARPRHMTAWLCVVVFLVGAMLSVFGSTSPAKANDLGYPHAAMACSSYPHATDGTGYWCPGYSWSPTPNGSPWSPRGYGYRNCTDYVAWKLISLGVASSKVTGLGNGGEWYDNAPSKNLSRGTTPQVGAAAVVPSDTAGYGGYGHVAYVVAVHSNGTITVLEYNYDQGGHGNTRTGTPASMKFTRFVYFGEHMTDPPENSGGDSNSTPPPTPHLFEAFHWNTNSGMTEVRQLNASNNFTTWSGGWTTPDGWHGGDTTDYGMADANGDGVQDLYVILYCCTGSGMTEVKILNGASNFTQWVGGWVTADNYHTPGMVRYAVGNFDGDTKPDVYVIPTNNTPSGKVEVKVLTGASNFSQWAGGWVTPDGWHDSNGVDFVLSTCGAGGRPHLYEILHENTNSGMTEVRQFDGATSYTTFVGGWVTPDGVHSGDHVAYTAGGCNTNGKPNIYIIAHSHTNSGMTEVKVLNGANDFTQWVGGWVTPDGWHSGFDIDYVMPLS